jgi:CheY-like chemotaxis protein
VNATLSWARLTARRIRRNDVTKRPVILCVDDEWNGLEGRRILFEERGYNVLVAASGEEALQLFASHPIDLVLLDYHLPKANGDVIAERMKASQPDVPIAMLSADEGLPESALESVDVFISKSESPTSLLEMVEHLLDLRFLFAPLHDVGGGRRRYTA